MKTRSLTTYPSASNVLFVFNSFAKQLSRLLLRSTSSFCIFSCKPRGFRFTIFCNTDRRRVTDWRRVLAGVSGFRLLSSLRRSAEHMLARLSKNVQSRAYSSTFKEPSLHSASSKLSTPSNPISFLARLQLLIEKPCRAEPCAGAGNLLQFRQSLVLPKCSRYGLGAVRCNTTFLHALRQCLDQCQSSKTLEGKTNLRVFIVELSLSISATASAPAELMPSLEVRLRISPP